MVQQVKDLAVARVAAVVQVQFLSQELPHAEDTDKKKERKEKKQKEGREGGRNEKGKKKMKASLPE